MQNPFLNLHDPIQPYPELDEEKNAQQYGRPVKPASTRSDFILRLGRLFFRMGEKLTHEDPCMELARQNS